MGFRSILFGVLSVGMLVGCGSGDSGGESESASMDRTEAESAESNGVPIDASLDLTEFPGTLREVTPSPEDQSQPARIAEARPLSEAEIGALLSRVERLPEAPEDSAEFALRENSAPPPRTGETVLATFPPEQDLQRPDDDSQDADPPLQVVRFSPDGDVPVARNVSLTFDRPMIAIDTQAAVSRQVPATLTPSVAGQWRWVGARTLVFEPEAGRLPMATEYRVEVPGDATAVDGVALEEAFSAEFRTPPLHLEAFHPRGDSVGREPLIILAFNQRVEARTLMDFLSVEAEGNAIDVVQLESVDLTEEDFPKKMQPAVADGRALIFRAREPLPVGAQVRVSLAEGAPSAEGPLKTKRPISESFQIYGPLRVVDHGCGGDCNPASSFVLQFSNNLADDQALEDLVMVEPAIDHLSVDKGDNYLLIDGFKQGDTRYTVEVDASLTDNFGQLLSGKRKLEFQVGSFSPNLRMLTDTLTTADPAGEPTVTILSANYDTAILTIYHVVPDNWGEYVTEMASIEPLSEVQPLLPGERIFQGEINLDPPRNRFGATHINLSRWMDGEYGHFLVQVEAGALFEDVPEPNRTPLEVTWVQATDLDLNAFVDSPRLIAWTSDLAGGEPRKDVRIRLGGTDQEVISGEQGLAEFRLPSRQDAPEAGWLIATDGSASTILPDLNVYWGGNRWVKPETEGKILWHVFDDRGMYRPGERVHVKGWIRELESGPDGDLTLLDGAPSVSYSVSGPRDYVLARGDADLNPTGGFDFAFDLPGNVNLGRAYIRLSVQRPDADTTKHASHSFRIEEFRTPEFEVTTAMNTPGRILAGQSVDLQTRANYYAGGPLSGAEVFWKVDAQPADYVPPNRDEWQFGVRSEWWFRQYRSEATESMIVTIESRTDSDGQHALQVALDDPMLPRTLSVSATSDVMDINRQAYSASTRFLVHPGVRMVGLKTPTYFVEQGEPIEVELITVDLDGEPEPETRVEVRTGRVTQDDGEETVEDVQDCEVFSDEQGQASCRFKTGTGGRYRIQATVEDAEGRESVTRITRWVAGGSVVASQSVETQEAQLIPERKAYAPGETVNLLVQAPFEKGSGLLNLKRQGLTGLQWFKIEDGSAILTFDLKESWMPAIGVHVVLIGSAPRSGEEDGGPMRPAIALGDLSVPISTNRRELDVSVSLDSDRLKPGARSEIRLVVTDAVGKPVPGAEVALWVVDEAVLALSDYQVADPIESFYPHRTYSMLQSYLRPSIHLDPRVTFDRVGLGAEPSPPAVAYMMDAQKLGRVRVTGSRIARSDLIGPPSIDVRTDFSPIATFQPTLGTDESGRVMTTIELPDNLTRYRVMAVATDGAKRFGKDESSLTTRLPLMIRPSPPRYLNFGDRFELPVIVQNQTDTPMTTQLVLETVNLELTGHRGYEVEVPAKDRVEVRFDAAAESAGTARYQVIGATDGHGDAANGEIQLWTPATSEAFATYGVIDGGAIMQPVTAPADVWPQFGGLEVTTSSTAMQSLTDAFLYLHDYPYRCTEQVASRLLATAALRDVLQAFGTGEMPADAEIRSALDSDLELLVRRQNGFEGFPLWRSDQESWPYVSVHVAHALVRLRGKGHEIDENLWVPTFDYIGQIEKHIPPDYGERYSRHIRAYAMYVESLAGTMDSERLLALLGEIEDLEAVTLESVGWLLSALSTAEGNAVQRKRERLLSFLGNRVEETAATAQFVTDIDDSGDYLVMHSRRTADAVILDALISAWPESDLIPKLVAGLQAHRVKGRWANTQENAFVLLALDRYFQRYESQTPDFVARSWLGDRFTGEHEFTGRTTERHRIDIPMRTLVEDGSDTRDLVIEKDGEGRAYYRIGLDYAPKSLQLDAADYGFAVERTYHPVDEPDDVRRLEDGTWRIRAGARVGIEITLAVPARRYHVALVDPLPAGLEPINPALAVQAGQASDQVSASSGHWWWGPWYEHQNLRAERAEAFASLVPGGVYTYRYTARATTPGEFVVPPAKAEEMYHPETFGRSASTWVIVVDDTATQQLE